LKAALISWVTRLVFGLMWLARFLPSRILARIGDGVGAVLFWLIPERRRVTRINLAKCFPEKTAVEREQLARAHFRAFCRAFVDQGILWWSPRERIEALVSIEGAENLKGLTRAIVFAPHFVGFEATLIRLTLDWPLAGMYSRQKDPVFDARLVASRTRFGGKAYPRQAGIWPALREIKAGSPYFYLPDLDYGRSRAVFVPFFGVPAATVTGLAFLARVTGAAVVPCVARMLPEGGYHARLYPAWRDFPSGDELADARRVMAFVEERVREMPEQYFWLHKRFKTRPPGEARFY
jgi:Kdo2-lipid IVA lauroyltransferase/acyltransferase